MVTPGQHAYYVTVVDGSRVGWLAGPYTTRSMAQSMVEPAKRLAGGYDSNTRAWWYAYGVTRILHADPEQPARVVFPHLKPSD